MKEEHIYVVCKECKEGETLSIINGQLEKTWHWVQIGDKIYHLCLCGECKVVISK